MPKRNRGNWGCNISCAGNAIEKLRGDEKTMIKASANWKINEITLDVQGSHVILMEPVRRGSKFVHGMASKAQIALTLQAAIELRDSLIEEIARYEAIDWMSNQGQSKFWVQCEKCKTKIRVEFSKDHDHSVCGIARFKCVNPQCDGETAILLKG